MIDDQSHSPTHAQKKQRMSRKVTRQDRCGPLAGLRLVGLRVYTERVFRYVHHPTTTARRARPKWLSWSRFLPA
jgi:hypothetical protein